jgi:hypothetical protein
VNKLNTSYYFLLYQHTEMSTNCDFHDSNVPLSDPTYIICACKKRAHKRCFTRSMGDGNDIRGTRIKPSCDTCGELYRMRVRVFSGFCSTAAARKLHGQVLLVIMQTIAILFTIIGYSYDSETVGVLNDNGVHAKSRTASVIIAFGSQIIIIDLLMLTIMNDHGHIYKSPGIIHNATTQRIIDALPIKHYVYYIMCCCVVLNVITQIFGCAVTYIRMGVFMMNTLTYLFGLLSCIAIAIMILVSYCIKCIGESIYYYAFTVEQFI